MEVGGSHFIAFKLIRGTQGYYIFDRFSILQHSHGKYWELCSIFLNLHHMIIIFPVFKMVAINYEKSYTH